MKRKLSEQFEMAGSGEVRQFLGMTIERGFEIRRHENWPARLPGRGLLGCFGMSECKLRSTRPMENRLKLRKVEVAHPSATST